MGKKEGSGAAVGVHQPATLHMGISYNQNGQYIQINLNSTLASHSSAQNTDTIYDRTSWVQAKTSAGSTLNPKFAEYTSRPTNTSVLYCIKY